MTGALKVYVSTGQPKDGESTQTVTLSNGTTETTSQGYNNKAEVLDFGNVSGITSVSITDGGLFYSFELDGALLVDSGAQWNTSQIWSDNVSSDDGNYFSNDYLPQNGFDGNLNSEVTSKTQGTGGTLTVSNLGFTGTYVVRVNATGSDVTVNGSSKAGDYTKEWVEFTGVSDPSTIVVSGGGASHTSAAASIFAVEINGALLVDGNGGAYNTLFQTWDESATLGLFFFNENTGKTITSFELNRKYGLTAAAPDAGIYDLTFQPRAQVLEYLKQKTAYLPLEDLFPQLEATEAKLANTEESLTATQTELVQVRAERDEAKDKLEDQISKLAARIALLETPKKGTKK